MAQSQIMYGLGQPDFFSSDNRFVPVEPMKFDLSGEGGEIVSKKFVDGKLQIAGSLLSSESYKLKVGIQAASFTAIAFAHGEVAKVTPSIVLPEVREARVPLVAPFEVVDVDFGTSLGVWVFQVDPIDTAMVLSAGAPPVGAFEIDVVGTKLVFNAADAGATIKYRVFKTYTNVRTIGKETLSQVDILNQFAFSGVGYTDGRRCRLTIPKMSRISVPSLSLSDVSTLEVEFRLAVATGNRAAYTITEI